MLKFEQLLPDGKVQYSEIVNGRKVFATTRGGAAAATRIFEIMKQTGGVAKSPAVRIDSRRTT